MRRRKGNLRYLSWKETVLCGILSGIAKGQGPAWWKAHSSKHSAISPSIPFLILLLDYLPATWSLLAEWSRDLFFLLWSEGESAQSLSPASVAGILYTWSYSATKWGCKNIIVSLDTWTGQDKCLKCSLSYHQVSNKTIPFFSNAYLLSITAPNSTWEI